MTFCASCERRPPADHSSTSCRLKRRKRMGSGDPSGLQNRRELASLALVSSTLTRFRQFHIKNNQMYTSATCEGVF